MKVCNNEIFSILNFNVFESSVFSDKFLIILLCLSFLSSLYISNKSTTASATVNVKVTTDGGSTFYHIGKSLEVPPNNTLTLDKPVNLENNDIVRVIADPNPDSSSVDVEAYASILELT